LCSPHGRQAVCHGWGRPPGSTPRPGTRGRQGPPGTRVLASTCEYLREYPRLPGVLKAAQGLEAGPKLRGLFQASRTSRLIYKASSPTGLFAKFQVAIGWGLRSYLPSFFGINSEGYCAPSHSLEHISFKSTMAAIY
jgi:hypothetical protein